MKGLLESFRKQHRTIASQIAATDRALAWEGPEAIAEAFEALRATLEADLADAAHLLEGGVLATGEGRPADLPTRIAQSYAACLRAMNASVAAFLADHRAGALDLPRLRRDWKLARQLLLDRIGCAEGMLYPLREAGSGSAQS